jgi:hypothetical protein
MTSAEQSEASPDADSSTFGLPGGVSDTGPDIVLCKTHRNSPSCPSSTEPLPEGGKPPKMEGRGVYRLLLVVLVLVVGILTDSRRLVEAASFML